MSYKLTKERVKEIIKGFEDTMMCTCDLDNWEPEELTKHCWVCGIHKSAMTEFRTFKDWWKILLDGEGE